MSLEKTLRLKGMDNPRYPIFQGGMGIGISLCELASAVSCEGGFGIISSAALDQVVAKRFGQKRIPLAKAVEMEVYVTKKSGGFAGINIMCALQSSYEDSVKGAVNGNADMIVSGAGLPMNLPSLVETYAGKNHKINLVPIVSSARALELICQKWEKQNYCPDAIVLEGPKAGGHLGWNYKQVNEAGENFLENYDLFKKLLQPVLAAAKKYGNIPIIVAGGIYTHQDILYALSEGALGVQMGTRFAATFESGATDEFKKAIIDAKKEDIALGNEYWGSSCGLPFRYLKTSPLAKQKKETTEKSSFCICSTLLGAYGLDKTNCWEKIPRCPEGYVRPKAKDCSAAGCANYLPLYTSGTEAYRVDKISSVKGLMKELIG